MSENRILPETFGISGVQDATYLWSLFNECTDNDLLQIVHIFFNQINGMEAFFYYMMSKRCIVDHMFSFTQRYLSTLRPIGIISHIIDGWEDFFLHSNYTLGNPSHIEIEMYRQHIIEILSFILQHVGETRLPLYYQCRLLDYFSILYHEGRGEGEGGEDDEGDEEDEDDDEEDNNDEEDEGGEDNDGEEGSGEEDREDDREEGERDDYFPG
jgi:hypothetical protein